MTPLHKGRIHKPDPISPYEKDKNARRKSKLGRDGYRADNGIVAFGVLDESESNFKLKENSQCMSKTSKTEPDV
jgi:hypothetical protein